MHGNMPQGPNYSTMVGEIYGNYINIKRGHGHADLLDHRGGEALCFFNSVTTGSLYSQLREEYADNSTATTPTCNMSTIHTIGTTG